jgi:hypothetical protein
VTAGSPPQHGADIVDDTSFHRSPFGCAIPAKQQPEFIAFLAQQFEPHARK